MKKKKEIIMWGIWSPIDKKPVLCCRDEYTAFHGKLIYDNLEQAKAFCYGFSHAKDMSSGDDFFCEIYNHMDCNDEQFENEIKSYLERHNVI